MRTLIQLPDGREVFSGGAGAAVLRATLRRRCNTHTDLTPGSVCPAQLQLRLTGVTLTPGDRLQVYRSNGQTKKKVGVFLVTEQQLRGIATADITAQDPLCLLRQDVTGWLAGLDRWPYSLGELADMVCRQCGVELATTDFPSADIPVETFAARDVTGEDLLGWIAQLAGCFCRANAQGQAEFAWYEEVPDTTVAPSGSIRPASWHDGHLTLRGADPLSQAVATDDGQGNVTVTVPRKLWYYQDTLLRAAMPVAPIDRVLLRRDVSDVGISYPEDAGGNTCILSSPLLCSIQAPSLQQVAKTLYERLSALNYTPSRMVFPEEAEVQPGQLLPVTDSTGQQFFTCVSATVTADGRTEAESTGNHLRDNTHALRTVAGLKGKILQLQMDVDGIYAQNSDAAGRMSQMELDVEGIRTQVSHRQETEAGLDARLTAVEQKAESVDITVRRLQDDGTDRVVTRSGYSFTDEGLTIRRQGEQMCNLLDHTGMYVTRDDEVILQANGQGVEATDVSVRNYLVVGDHARFEDYESGTACYYI